LPVVDLRLKFALAAAEYNQRTCIVVTQVRGEIAPVVIGVVVDGVSEVLNLTAQDIEDTPDFGDDTVSAFSSHGQGKGEVKILLDIDQVLSTPTCTIWRHSLHSSSVGRLAYTSERSSPPRHLTPRHVIKPKGSIMQFVISPSAPKSC